MGGPELQLGIARRPQLDEKLLSAVVQLDSGDHLRVRAVERFRNAQNRGQRLDDGPPLRPERAEIGVRSLR